jgi:predicted aconitase
MGVFLVESWLVKEGKEKEHEEECEKILDYIRKNREKFEELKSVRMFRIFTGRQSNVSIYIQEFGSLAEMEEFDKKIVKDQNYMDRIRRWQSLIQKHSIKAEIWFDELREKWVNEES